MAQKDYYILLGVSPTATTRSIQRAFRALAKRYHPDRVGSQGTSAFQDIVEAYEVLSNPERRAIYDRDLRPAAPAERYGLQPEPQSMLSDFMTIRPSLEALRVLRNFTGAGTPKGEQVEGLNLEVILSPAEARRGGVLRLGVPVFAPCTRCAGTGYTWGVACLACMGQGMREQEKMVAVRIPPQVRHGTRIEIPLRGLGLHNLYLCLHIAVMSWG